MSEHNDFRKDVSEWALLENGRLYKLNKSPFIIGRDPKTVDLYLDRKTVSRNQVQLTEINGKWYLEDMNSSSGVWLNGGRINIAQQYALDPKDRIEFSDFIFTFLCVKNGEDSLVNNVEYGTVDQEMKSFDAQNSSFSKPLSTQVAKFSKQSNINRELNHFKATLEVFLKENTLDQKALSRLRKLILLAQRQSDQEAVIENVMDDVFSSYSGYPAESKKTSQPQSGSQSDKIDLDDDQQKKGNTNVNSSTGQNQQAVAGRIKGPVFHPVKIEGDWIKIPVTKIPFTIGRGPDNVDFAFRATGISRSHCLVSFYDGFYHISDLGSTNGIYLNKRRIKPNKDYRVKNGDTVSLGVNQFYLELP
jgi:pSer/pThr/pTyr-binding forkhead associated (FHA) protein